MAWIRQKSSRQANKMKIYTAIPLWNSLWNDWSQHLNEGKTIFRNPVSNFASLPCNYQAQRVSYLLQD